MQKNIVRQMLPAAEDKELKEMDDEIDTAEESAPLPNEDDLNFNVEEG